MQKQNEGSRMDVQRHREKKVKEMNGLVDILQDCWLIVRTLCVYDIILFIITHIMI